MVDGNEATHSIEAIVTHVRYKPETYHNDIALIKLTQPIKFSRFILPACLPEQDFAEKVSFSSTESKKGDNNSMTEFHTFLPVVDAAASWVGQWFRPPW